MDKYLIRPAIAEDIFGLSNLFKLMVFEFEPTNTPNMDWWIDRQRVILQHQDYFQWVAEGEYKQLLGMVDFMIIKEPSDGKIHAIGQQFYVLPEYRKKTSMAGRLWKTASAEACKMSQVFDTTAYEQTKGFWKKRGFEFYCYSLRKEVQKCR